MLLLEPRAEMKKPTSYLLVLLASQLAAAEVTDSAANGFTTVNEVTVDANRAAAWQAALDVGRWWSPDHTISGDAGRLSIDASLKGCFCESLGGDAGVVHLIVTTVMPETSLRMTGGLGPLGLPGGNGGCHLFGVPFPIRSHSSSQRDPTRVAGRQSPAGLPSVWPILRKRKGHGQVLGEDSKGGKRNKTIPDTY